MIKIGETIHNTPSSRLSSIRQSAPFYLLGYLELKNLTKPQIECVEAEVRKELEKHCELTHIKKDHFVYKMTIAKEKYYQAQCYADLAMYYAKRYCDSQGFVYKQGTKNYNK